MDDFNSILYLYERARYRGEAFEAAVALIVEQQLGLLQE